MRRLAKGKILQAVFSVFMFLLAGHAALASGTFEQLKERFNRDKGSVRLILLVSPTCPACVGGAQWIEDQILKQYPKLDIHVYAIWYEMYPGDSPKAFPSARKMMPNPRVEHYWDKKKAAGRWFRENVPSKYKKPIMWDAYYLYESAPPDGNRNALGASGCRNPPSERPITAFATVALPAAGRPDQRPHERTFQQNS
jgi:hypothetical protein